MNAVIITFPYSNKEYGAKCIIDSLERGEAPISLGSIYETYGNSEEINNKLYEAVKKLLLTVSKLVVYDNLGHSRSMIEIIEIAKGYNIEVLTRKIKN